MTLLETWNRTNDERAAGARKKLRGEIEDLIRLGGGDFAVAENLGPKSAWLDFDAACFCGQAMKVDAKWREPCLKHLETFVQRGLAPRDRKIVEKYCDSLKNDPRFQEFLGGPLSQVTPPPVSLFVDPFKESGR